MHDQILHIHFSFAGRMTDFVLTWWKLIGFLGTLMFAGRWVVQLIASAKRSKPTFPILFWIMSMCGSVMILSYFVFGKNDSVGIVSNLFPAAVSSYNLFLIVTNKRKSKNGPAEDAKGSGSS